MRHVLEKSLILILLVILFTCTGLSNNTYAMSDAITSGDGFIDIGKEENQKNSAIDRDSLKTTSAKIYNILFAIAVVIAVAVGMIIGIQFMIASVDEKAKIKETLVPYIIGVFIVFAAFPIWKIVVGIGNSLDYTQTQEDAKQDVNSGKSTSVIEKVKAGYREEENNYAEHGWVYNKKTGEFVYSEGSDDEQRKSNIDIINETKRKLNTERKTKFNRRWIL